MVVVVVAADAIMVAWNAAVTRILGFSKAVRLRRL